MRNPWCENATDFFVPVSFVLGSRMAQMSANKDFDIHFLWGEMKLRKVVSI